jgi:NagD protein
MADRRIRPALDYGAYVFDIDGTVCLGDAMIGAAVETIAELKRLGRRVVYMTNDATLSEAEHAARLTRLGLSTPAPDVVTPIGATISLLRKQREPAPVFVIGAECINVACAAAGYAPTEDPRAACAVIVSHDHDFSYAKLNTALHALRNGAALLATNADAFRPTPAGGEPGTGAILAAVERASGSRAEVTGKPSIHMRDALRIVVGSSQRCLIVGDQLDTDIRLAGDAGVDSALVLTGATDEAMLAASTTTPTYVIPSLDAILKPR